MKRTERLFGEKMSLFIIGTVVFLSCFFSSCTEEYDLQIEGKQKLIITAEITNLEPPYYVQLKKSMNTFVDYTEYDIHNAYGYETVQDALVIISDENAIVDTLSLAPDTITYWSDAYEDSITYENTYSGKNGYYVTSKITGTPEHTYSLQVEWNGHTYSAECKMPKAVAIDSIGDFREPTKEDDLTEGGYIPHLWFADDTTADNYYVFCMPMSGGSIWNNTIISDKHIDSDVAGIDVFAGESAQGYGRGTVIGTHVSKEWGYEEIIMYSVTKEVYDYYDSAIKQIRYDGGVYTPSPATPPTNIKGGALGLFNVASADYRYFY